MTANPTAADQPFTIVLDEDESLVAEGRLRESDAGPTWAKHRVTVQLDDADTSGHSLDASIVAISLRFDDEVEGHALSLHFPNAEKAEQFRRRAVATGVLAGALIVGVTAAQLSVATPAATTVAPAAPIAAPAPRTQPVVNPLIPAEDIAPAVPRAQPDVNPLLPAEDLAPAVPRTEPVVNPLIPAEDLAPAVPRGATAPKLPASHVAQTTATSPASLSPAERHREEHQ